MMHRTTISFQCRVLSTEKGLIFGKIIKIQFNYIVWMEMVFFNSHSKTKILPKCKQFCINKYINLKAENNKS